MPGQCNGYPRLAGCMRIARLCLAKWRFSCNETCLIRTRAWEPWLQVSAGKQGPVLAKAFDIHRMTAEQQAARAALQSLGLQVCAPKPS